MENNSMNLIGIGQGYLGPGIANQDSISLLATKIMQTYDREKKGRLSKTDIASIMITMYRSVNKKFSPSKYDIETYGKVMDYNGDGTVTKSDIESLIRRYLAVDVEITRSVRTTVSRVTSSTRNKSIDPESLKGIFDADDLDRDGLIGRYEFGRILLANAKKLNIDPSTVNTDEIFKNIDNDKDGKIDFNQFLEGIKMA